jgi:inhibitor of KinA
VTSQRAFPVFTPVAEHSLLIEFGETIARIINDQVVALDDAIAKSPFDGFLEAVPAYASLLIRFDPTITDWLQVESHARGLLGRTSIARTAATREVSVCYDADLAPDLPAVAAAACLTEEAVIAAHLAGRYDVFMYGFAPGYAYLAGVPEVIWLPRKPTAVRGVAAGSVLIAGQQCLVSTLTMPTGWWIIGRSPSRILSREEIHPFLFEVGDKVSFKRIDRATFDVEMCE